MKTPISMLSNLPPLRREGNIIYFPGAWREEAPDAGCCEIYEYPDSKPSEVYFDGAECENYEKDL
jgi:hypothetical protein